MTSVQIFYILLAAAALFLILLIYFVWKKSLLLQTPMPKTPLPCQPDDFHLAYENVLFSAADGTIIKGWFIPSLDEFSSDAIILCHGRGSNKGQMLMNTHFLAEKYNLLYIDFRSCGESKGNSSTIGYMETRDFDAAYNFLKNCKEGYADRIAAFGCSLGASVALYGAVKYPDIIGIAAESLFLSLRSVVKNWCRIKMRLFLPFVPLALYFSRRRLKTDPEAYTPLHNASKLKCPILFIYGDNDRLVSEEERQELVRICGSPIKEEFIINGATHTKCAETGGVMYRERISAFFEKVFSLPAPMKDNSKAEENVRNEENYMPKCYDGVKNETDSLSSVQAAGNKASEELPVPKIKKKKNKKHK